MIIVPAIFEKNFNEAERKFDLIKDLSKWVQIDVADGVLVEGKSFELELLNKLNLENNLIETHLMVKEPFKWVEKSLFAGAARITGQVELMSNRDSFVEAVHEQGAEAGLAFDIETKIDDIPEETEVVLLMTRKAGFEHYEIDGRIWGKIEELRKIQKDGNHKFLIGVDGGVNFENINKFKEAGVDIANVTGAIFEGGVEENWEELISLL